jgi:hypothetical protein
MHIALPGQANPVRVRTQGTTRCGNEFRRMLFTHDDQVNPRTPQMSKHSARTGR